MNVVWPPYYFGIALVFFVLALLLYLSLAKKWSLFDTPNERSSHQQITIRGAGVIYLVAMLTYFILSGWKYPSILLGSLGLGIVSFIDDLKSLSAKSRLIIHCAIIGFFLYDLGFLGGYWFVPVLVAYFLWLMNAYNFMDGINGITFMNTNSHLIALLLMNHYCVQFIDSNLLLLVLLANNVFGFFNFRKKAVCFLGDVGSIPLGFLLIALTLILAMRIESLNPLVFFLVYMIDSGWTIGQRLWNKENILKPHRKHLYQLLVNEFGMKHLSVSTIYFSIQMIVNLTYILNFENLKGNWFLPLIFALFSIVYCIAKFYLLKKIDRKAIIS